MSRSASHATIPPSHFESLAANEQAYFWHRLRVRWAERLIRRAFADPQSLAVVDVGCGTGGFISALHHRLKFRDVRGVDTSSHATTLAGRHGIEVQQIDPADYHLPPGTDLVLLMDVIEHVEDDTALLARTLNDLGPNGRVIISVPAFPQLFSDWDRFLGHFRRYRKADMRRLVGRAGGDVETLSYAFSFLYPAAVMRRSVPASDDQCEFPPVSAWLGGLLYGFGAFELAVSRVIPIPFGTSLFAVVRRAP
jgi:SAM-dependent methyltransferase